MKTKTMVLAIACLLTAGAWCLVDMQPEAEAAAETPAVDLFESDVEVCDPLEEDWLMVCGCRDLCRFDFQCGPGGACVPSGPCGCKVCTSAF